MRIIRIIIEDILIGYLIGVAVGVCVVLVVFHGLKWVYRKIRNRKKNDTPDSEDS